MVKKVFAAFAMLLCAAVPGVQSQEVGNAEVG
jgi:hypothetical protein